MLKHIYPEQITSNVAYSLIGKRAIAGKRLHDLSSYTVIIIADELEDEVLIKNIADDILTRGCKNIALCGEASDEMQDIFDQEDREINGFNDITGYEDFAVTRRFEDIEQLPEEIEMCWNEVLVICGDISLLRECQSIIEES